MFMVFLEKKLDLSEYLNAINHKKEPLMDGDEIAEKEYVPFVINRCLSYFPDTIFFINEINQLHSLPKKMQFDYLRMSIRKKKRFSPWLKKKKIEKIDIIKEYFGYSNEKALQVVDLITEDDLVSMQESLYKGGTEKMKKPK